MYGAPVMYRLLERNPASPKNSRHPASASANEAALEKRETGRKQSAAGAVETTTARSNSWEASDQRRRPKRHSIRSGVSCVWGILWLKPSDHPTGPADQD